MTENNGTTNLNDLPNSNENILLNISEPTSNVVETNTINELVSGIQDATGGGVLELPSRDISQKTTQITNDEKIKVNYIPKTEDYIKQYETKEEILKNERLQENRKDNIDFLFNELNTYVIIALLYFLFQLPFVNKHLYHYLKTCFDSDGNLNFQGVVVKSLLFAAIIYGIDKFILNLIEL